jgi:hypothetical protein
VFFFLSIKVYVFSSFGRGTDWALHRDVRRNQLLQRQGRSGSVRGHRQLREMRAPRASGILVARRVALRPLLIACISRNNGCGAKPGLWGGQCPLTLHWGKSQCEGRGGWRFATGISASMGAPQKCTDHSIASRRQQAHTRKRVPAALPHTYGRD